MEEILAKYFSGEVTKDERSLVESWRSESESNALSYLEAKTIWLHTQDMKTPDKAVLKNIFSEKQHTKEIKLWNSNWIKYATAASIAIVLAFIFILNRNSDVGYQTESLADGSEAALHGDSQIELISMNEEVREVKITGKAYFNIERDESRPFIIHTDNAIVKVLGTSFVIDTYNDKTEVCVESGLVELRKADREVSIKLSKGEMGLILDTNEGIIKKNNNNLNYLSWKTKVLTFKDTRMEEVVRVIEDVYGIEVKLENPDFKSCKLTAKFNRKKPKDAIEIIARTFNIDFDFTDGVATLKGKGC